jgi:hypothetical protein
MELTVDQIKEDIRLNVVDFEDFNSRVVRAYNDGSGKGSRPMIRLREACLRWHRRSPDFSYRP